MGQAYETNGLDEAVRPGERVDQIRNFAQRIWKLSTTENQDIRAGFHPKENHWKRSFRWGQSVSQQEDQRSGSHQKDEETRNDLQKSGCSR